MVILIVTVLLSYSIIFSTNSYAAISFKGELTDSISNDSVLISINDLRRVNQKLVELRYEKEINDSLRSIVYQDDVIIDLYQKRCINLNMQIDKNKKQRNILGGIAAVTTITSILLCIFK